MSETPGTDTVYLNSFPSSWSVESGEVDLVSGAVHTNGVCAIVATPDRVYSLGLDKNLKTFQTATNEYK